MKVMAMNTRMTTGKKNRPVIIRNKKQEVMEA